MPMMLICCRLPPYTVELLCWGSDAGDSPEREASCCSIAAWKWWPGDAEYTDWPIVRIRQEVKGQLWLLDWGLLLLSYPARNHSTWRVLQRKMSCRIRFSSASRATDPGGREMLQAAFVPAASNAPKHLRPGSHSVWAPGAHGSSAVSATGISSFSFRCN